MTLSCAQVEKRLAEWVGERSLSDASLLAHLESCPGCRGKFEQWQQIARQLRAVRVEPNPALTARTQALLRLRGAELRQKRRLFGLIGAIGVVYLLVSLVWFRLVWELTGAFQPAWAHGWLFRVAAVAGINLMPIAILMVLLLFIEESAGVTGSFIREDTSYV